MGSVTRSAQLPSVCTLLLPSRRPRSSDRSGAPATQQTFPMAPASRSPTSCDLEAAQRCESLPRGFRRDCGHSGSGCLRLKCARNAKSPHHPAEDPDLTPNDSTSFPIIITKSTPLLYPMVGIYYYTATRAAARFRLFQGLGFKGLKGLASVALRSVAHPKPSGLLSAKWSQWRHEQASEP